MNNLQKEDIDNFAKSKNISLNEEELNYTYLFIKKNWEKIIGNPHLFNIDHYKDRYSETNFSKIKKVYLEYLQNYGNRLGL